MTRYPLSFARHFTHRAVLLLAVITVWGVGTWGYYQEKRAETPPEGNGERLIWSAMDAVLMFTWQGRIPQSDLGGLRWIHNTARLAAGCFSTLALAGLVLRFLRWDFSLGWRIRGAHVVVTPLNDRSLALARYRRDQGDRVLVVDDNPPALLLEALGTSQIAFLHGPVTEPETWDEACLHDAARVIVTGSEDSRHGAIVAAMREYLRHQHGRPRPLRCEVEIQSPDLAGDLRTCLGPTTGNADQSSQPIQLEVRPFDPVAVAARELLRDRMPVDREGIRPGDDARPTLVILGMGRMGRALAVEALRTGILANGQPLRLVLVDEHLRDNLATVQFHHPGFPGMDPAMDSPAQGAVRASCRIGMHEEPVESLATLRMVRELATEAGRWLCVTVCLHEDAASISAALLLRKHLSGIDARIAVRLHGTHGVEVLLRATDNDFGNASRPATPLIWFGIQELAAPADLLEEGNPRESSPDNRPTHERIQRRAIGLETAPGTLPAPPGSPVPDSVIDGLARMEQEHGRIDRLLDGWEPTVGELDPVHRRDPDLVAWDQLRPAAREALRARIRRRVEGWLGECPAGNPGEVPWAVWEPPSTSRADDPADVPTLPWSMSVRVMIRREDGAILWVRRSGTSRHWPGCWELPGGKVDPGEAFADAALREVREETGLEIRLGTVMGASSFDMAHARIATLYLEGSLIGGTPREESPGAEIGWHSPAEIDWNKVTPGDRDTLKSLPLFQPQTSNPAGTCPIPAPAASTIPSTSNST